MSDRCIRKPTRRGFLERALALTGVMPLLPRVMQQVALWSVASTTPAAAAPFVNVAARYRSMNRDEAAFTETMVNVLCPADQLTPNGVTCGLATLIDRELAVDVRAHAARFKAGIAAANTASDARFGVPFHQLAASDAGAFLSDMAAGSVIDGDVPLASWLHDPVYPLLVHACFAGPLYDEYNNTVFWKLFGDLGEPTAHRLHRAAWRFEPRGSSDDSGGGHELQVGRFMLDELRLT